jgi:hypothetical protein
MIIQLCCHLLKTERLKNRYRNAYAEKSQWGICRDVAVTVTCITYPIVKRCELI